MSEAKWKNPYSLCEQLRYGSFNDSGQGPPCRFFLFPLGDARGQGQDDRVKKK